MKFKVLSTILFFTFFNSFAQSTIPNSGFENWDNATQNTAEPQSWNGIKTGTGNSTAINFAPQTVFRESNNPRSGTYCARLQTVNVSIVNVIAPGSMSTGRFFAPSLSAAEGYVATVPNDPNFSLPFTGRPDSIIFWMRYTRVGNDFPSLTALLHVGNAYQPEQPVNGNHPDSSVNIIGRAIWQGPTSSVSSWTRVAVPFVYVDNRTPQYLLIVATPTGNANPTTAGSQLWIDDVSFVTCTGFSVAANTTNATTVGGSNGSTTAVVTGGTASFNYFWSTGATSASVTNISQGNYCVTVTDANSCTASACGAVSEPSCAGVSLSINTTDVTTNGGSDGSATAVTSGTTGTVVYEWAPGGATSSSISNLTAGIYSVTITDGVGCTATANGTVSSPACSGFSVLVSGTSVTVFQGSNGTATTDVSGGQTPFSYSWSNSATTEDINALPVGTYCVTVTDDNNCSVSDCVTIVEDIDCSTFEVSVNTTPATSANGTDGTAESVVTNENGNVIYIWSNSATTPILNDLSSGNYCVTATDEAGCTATACGNVTFTVGIENNQLAYQIFPNPTQGKLFIQLESAAAYTFTVFDMNGKIVSNIAFETHETTISISTLTNGMYFYEIKNTTNGLSQKGKFLKN